jgi:hypothetical protein
MFHHRSSDDKNASQVSCKMLAVNATRGFSVVKELAARESVTTKSAFDALLFT